MPLYTAEIRMSLDDATEVRTSGATQPAGGAVYRPLDENADPGQHEIDNRLLEIVVADLCDCGRIQRGAGVGCSGRAGRRLGTVFSDSTIRPNDARVVYDAGRWIVLFDFNGALVSFD